MTEARALDIYLQDSRIGMIAALEEDSQRLHIRRGLCRRSGRPRLSLSYQDSYGALINKPQPYGVRLEPFFSNLLPEGALRDYLAGRAGVKAMREFPRLASLGLDLPGAVRAAPAEAEVLPAIEQLAGAAR
jgi:serine/threonine-protein kinase HipA